MKNLPFILGLSIAFSSTGFSVLGRDISIGMVVALIYMFAQLGNINSLGLLSQKYGKVIFLPLAVIVLMLINNILHSGIGNNTLFAMTYLMDYVLFLFVLINTLSDETCVTKMLNGLTMGATLMAVFYVLGIGVSDMITLDGDRFSVLGMNANVLGLLETLAFIFSLNHIILNQEIKKPVTNGFYLVCIILQLNMILSTASRTAFLITGITFVVSILLTNYSKKRKILFVAVGLSVFAAGLYYFIRNSDAIVLIRLLNGSDEGSMSGREMIWEELMPYVKNASLFGQGETGYNIISRRIFGQYKSPHNELIFLMITVGIVGTIMMVWFWIATFFRGFRRYRNTKDPIAILLIIPLLFAILSQQLLYEKFGWISYAYMMVGSYSATRKRIIQTAPRIKQVKNKTVTI